MRSRYFRSTFAFDDPARTEQHLADHYGVARIEREFRSFRQELSGDATVQLHSGRFDGAYTATVEIDQFVVATAAGSCGWTEGRESGDMSIEPVLFQPRTPYTNHLADTENRAVVFDADALRRTARLLYGRHDLEVCFDGPLPATPRTGGTWSAVETVARSVLDAGALENDLVRAGLFRLLAVSTLESFRLVGDRPALRAAAERVRRVYEVGVRYLGDHASLPITIDDAATAAGASVAELVQAFRAHDPSGSTPTAALRRIRLDAARRELETADPSSGDTVRDVAARWGFTSPRRFAAAFRAAFGVEPTASRER